MNEKRMWGNLVAVLGVVVAVAALIQGEQPLLGAAVGVALLYGGLAWAKRAG